MGGGARRDGAAKRQGEILDATDFEAPARVRRLKKRWLLLFGAAVLLIAAWLGLRYNAPVAVELPIVNTGETEVRLLLHGDGVLQHALVHLPPGRRERVKLSTTRGALRVQSESERAKIDALLLDDASALKDARVELEVRSASELVLVPRSE